MIVTIVGATGQQGCGVITAFVSDSRYHVRGITRNPNSASSKELYSKGVEMVKGDLDDLDSLKTAFTSSYVIFAVTDFYAPFEALGAESASII